MTQSLSNEHMRDQHEVNKPNGNRATERSHDKSSGSGSGSGYAIRAQENGYLRSRRERRRRRRSNALSKYPD